MDNLERTVPPVRLALYLCGDPDPPIAAVHGNYLAWFRAAMAPEVTLIPVDPRKEGSDLSLLDQVDGVVISGSPHSVYDPLPWISGLEALVRDAVLRRRMPLLGVCFGHQLLAQALGGVVTRNPRGREIGTAELVQNNDGLQSPLLAGLKRRFHVQVTHCDTVAALPPGAVVLARSMLDDCQVFAVAERAYGVQFHPEVTADIIRGYLHARRERIAAEGIDVDALLAGVQDTDAGRHIFARFVDEVRAAREVTVG